MTTVFTLGRCEFAEGPTSIDQAGSTVTLSGDLWCDTYAELVARRFQLLGMVNNPDEDVFPFYSDDDALSYLNGFYRVLDASVGSTTVMSESPTVPFAVTLERVVDSATARVEQYNNSLIRTNGHSITSVSHAQRFVPPPVILDFAQGSSTFSSNAIRPTTDGGDVTVLFTLLSLPTSGSVTYVVTPANLYGGGCRIEYQAADDAWYPLVGRDLPPDAGGRWRISNGAFRFAPTATLGRWSVAAYNGTAWESTDVAANAFQSSAHHEVTIAANLTTWLVPTILRNSPDAVTIATSGTNSTTGRFDQVITLRRGSYHVEFTTWGGAAGRPGLRAAAATASTALSTATLGLRATSNDAEGNRLVLISAPACVNDTTNGRIYVDDASTTNKHTFAFGIEYDGSSAATRNSAIEIARQFIAPPLVSSRVLKS